MIPAKRLVQRLGGINSLKEGEMTMKKMVLFLVLVFLGIVVQGMPGKVHVGDCQEVFCGLEGDNLQQAFKEVSKGIDYDLLP